MYPKEQKESEKFKSIKDKMYTNLEIQTCRVHMQIQFTQSYWKEGKKVCYECKALLLKSIYILSND